MASYSGFRITLLAGDYPAKYDNFVTAAESVANEVESARGGFASLQAGLVGYAGMTAHLPAAGFRITGLADPVGGGDAANKQWVETLALSASIPVSPGDAGKVMSNNGSTLQWAPSDSLLPAMAGHAGKFLGTDGTTRSWMRPVITLSYDSRGDIRSLSGVDLQAWVLVDGLGLFLHAPGDAGPDDDETAFACAGGCWLLVCPSWDVVEALTLAAESAQDDRLTSAESRLSAAEGFTARMFRATSAQSAISLAAGSNTSFTVAVAGAVVGGNVVVTAPTAPTQNAVTAWALVSAAGVVTVYVGNASAGPSGGYGAGNWQITVINP